MEAQPGKPTSSHNTTVWNISFWRVSFSWEFAKVNKFVVDIYLKEKVFKDFLSLWFDNYWQEPAAAAERENKIEILTDKQTRDWDVVFISPTDFGQNKMSRCSQKQADWNSVISKAIV